MKAKKRVFLISTVIFTVILSGIAMAGWTTSSNLAGDAIFDTSVMNQETPILLILVIIIIAGIIIYLRRNRNLKGQQRKAHLPR